MRNLLVTLSEQTWWRALEGAHTLVWIVGGLGAVVSFFVGAAEGVSLFWLLTFPLILLAAIVFLGERLYWRFGYCQLSVAATKVYDKLKDTTDVGAFSKGAGSKPEHVLDEMATAISSEVPIFGRQPPATALDELPRKIFAQGEIASGGAKFRKHGQQTFGYVDLTVRRVDVGRAIRAIRRNYAELSKGKG